MTTNLHLEAVRAAAAAASAAAATSGGEVSGGAAAGKLGSRGLEWFSVDLGEEYGAFDGALSSHAFTVR